MTLEQNELLASLRHHTFAAEEVLIKLLQSRNVPVPRLRDSDEVGEASEWNDAWKDVIQRKRYTLLVVCGRVYGCVCVRARALTRVCSATVRRLLQLV